MVSTPFSCKHDDRGERCAKWCGSDWACSDGEIDHEHEELKAALAAEQARAERLELVVKQYASECGGCNGLGYIGVKYWRGDIEFDADDQPCPDCADIRAALALRPSGDGVG